MHYVGVAAALSTFSASVPKDRQYRLAIISKWNTLPITFRVFDIFRRVPPLKPSP
jgi:hypothetical protein